MLLILMLATCLSPKQCNITSMKAFEVTDNGVRAACSALLSPLDVKHRKVLAIVYAQGVSVKMSNAGGACMSTPEKSNPTEYREAFLQNIEK